MLRARGWMGLIALGLWLVSSLSTAQTYPRRLHKTPQKQLQLPPLPSGPLSQVPMDQLPAAPPSVSYERGLLTIVAQNSTLADILVNVRRLTGAAIDIPPNATERVVTRLGPAPAREVLASLLNGTSFNYVMIGSPTNPLALSALLLTMRSAGGTDVPAASTFVAMANLYNPAVPAAEPVPQAIAVQPGNPTVAAAAENSDDEQDAEDAADTEHQAAGQQQGVTPAQGFQQMQDKQKLPPGFQPPMQTLPPH
jgi:hypothetical protein